MNEFFLEAAEEKQRETFSPRINKCINLQGASEDPQNIRLLPACVRPCSSKVKVNLRLTTREPVWLFLTLSVLFLP